MPYSKSGSKVTLFFEEIGLVIHKFENILAGFGSTGQLHFGGRYVHRIGIV